MIYLEKFIESAFSDCRGAERGNQRGRGEGERKGERGGGEGERAVEVWSERRNVGTSERGVPAGEQDGTRVGSKGGEVGWGRRYREGKKERKKKRMVV